jgi:hypothetical protein
MSMNHEPFDLRHAITTTHLDSASRITFNP